MRSPLPSTARTPEGLRPIAIRLCAPAGGSASVARTSPRTPAARRIDARPAAADAVCLLAPPAGIDNTTENLGLLAHPGRTDDGQATTPFHPRGPHLPAGANPGDAWARERASRMPFVRTAGELASLFLQPLKAGEEDAWPEQDKRFCFCGPPNSTSVTIANSHESFPEIYLRADCPLPMNDDAAVAHTQ